MLSFPRTSYSYFIYSVGKFMPYWPQISSLALYCFPRTFCGGFSFKLSVEGFG
jgi:hypothetical protein